MSVPVAISVWFLLPDYPHNTKAWYITEDDQRLAMQRAAKQNRAEITGVLDLKLVKRMFWSWRWWMLCLTYIFVRRLPIALRLSLLTWELLVRKFMPGQQLLRHLP